MKKMLILAAIVVLLLPNMAIAAGSCTAATITKQSITVTTYTCTGDSSGGSYPTKVSDVSIRGWVYAVDTIPGTPNPTAAWDATLKNANGYDVMEGAILNRSASAAERIKTGTWVDGPLTLAITGNSVNSAVIVVKVYTYKEN